MSLYTDLRDAGIEVSNHESDLQFPATDEALAILERHSDHRRQATRFFSLTDNGAPYIEVPFAYDPWWIQRAAK